jgi:hypothetical protein
MNQKTQYPCIGRQGQQTKIYLNCGAVGNKAGNTLGALLGTWWEHNKHMLGTIKIPKKTTNWGKVYLPCYIFVSR